MEVKQIATLMNDISSEIFGEEAIQTEDLSNIVDIGTAVFNANAVDHWTASLLDKVGKMVFVDRVYTGVVPQVLMDGWEYGAVLQKTSLSQLPEATENESWELSPGVVYEVNQFYGVNVESKFFSKKVTFEVPMSYAERQIKSAFNSGTQMNAFVSMVKTGIENSLTVKMDALIMRTLNNFIGETIYDDYGANALGSSSGVKAVNLLYKYNDEVAASPITSEKALTDPEFIRYSSREIGLYMNRMQRISTLFNIEGKERFTPKDKMHVVLLNDFVRSADSYLQSDTFHDEFTRLPKADVIPYWQAPGTSYAFDDVSKIDIKTSSGHDVEVTGVLGFIFDRDALGVSNLDRRVTTNWNAKAEFINAWEKMDAGYFNSLSEQGVVFFIADAPTNG